MRFKEPPLDLPSEMTTRLSCFRVFLAEQVWFLCFICSFILLWFLFLLFSLEQTLMVWTQGGCNRLREEHRLSIHVMSLKDSVTLTELSSPAQVFECHLSVSWKRQRESVASGGGHHSELQLKMITQKGPVISEQQNYVVRTTLWGFARFTLSHTEPGAILVSQFCLLGGGGCPEFKKHFLNWLHTNNCTKT